MHKNKIKYIVPITAALLIVIGLLAFAPGLPVSGNSGGNLLIGDTPPGEGMASFEDDGITYWVHLIASEWDGSGNGQVTMLLYGDTIGFCTARGPGVEIDFTDIYDEYPDDFPGNEPMNDISCGTAYGMAVDINGCKAEIEFHGFVHSDYPLISYMGMMTTDVKVTLGNDNEIEIEVFTPKDEIKMEGILSGNIEMETCPYE